jgi:hypothetical protein
VVGGRREEKERDGEKDVLDSDNFTEDDRDLQFGGAWLVRGRRKVEESSSACFDTAKEVTTRNE